MFRLIVAAGLTLTLVDSARAQNIFAQPGVSGRLSDHSHIDATKGGTGPTIYKVDGVALGGSVRVESSAYRQYQCNPSKPFVGFTWCQRKQTDTGRNGRFDSSTSILHAADGTVSYINGYIEPAFFSGSDVQSQIDSLARKYGEPRVLRLPARDRIAGAIIALYGNVTLDPMSAEDVAAYARGGRPARSGIPYDYLGDFQRSARARLPMYWIAGREGYIWSASFDAAGRGHLRFTAANAALFASSGISAASNASDATGRGAVAPEDTRPPEHQRTAAEGSGALAASVGSVSADWDSLPDNVRLCLENTLRRQRGSNVGALISQGVRPNSPLISHFINECSTGKPDGSSISAPTFGGPDDVALRFAEWTANYVLTKPVFSKAFQQCREVISLYQDRILQRLITAAGASDSRAEQQRIRSLADSLAEKRQTSATAACVKEFVASLRIAGSASGVQVDELSILEGRLRDSRFDLQRAAAARIDDLTDEGVSRLAAQMGLSQLNLADLRTEIDSITRTPSGSGYLACLAVREWIAWFSSDSFCHGQVMERKIMDVAGLLKVQ